MLSQVTIQTMLQEEKKSEQESKLIALTAEMDKILNLSSDTEYDQILGIDKATLSEMTLTQAKKNLYKKYDPIKFQSLNQNLPDKTTVVIKHIKAAANVVKNIIQYANMQTAWHLKYMKETLISFNKEEELKELDIDEFYAEKFTSLQQQLNNGQEECGNAITMRIIAEKKEKYQTPKTQEGQFLSLLYYYKEVDADEKVQGLQNIINLLQKNPCLLTCHLQFPEDFLNKPSIDDMEQGIDPIRNYRDYYGDFAKGKGYALHYACEINVPELIHYIMSQLTKDELMMQLRSIDQKDKTPMQYVYDREQSLQLLFDHPQLTQADKDTLIRSNEDFITKKSTLSENLRTRVSTILKRARDLKTNPAATQAFIDQELIQIKNDLNTQLIDIRILFFRGFSNDASKTLFFDICEHYKKYINETTPKKTPVNAEIKVELDKIMSFFINELVSYLKKNPEAVAKLNQEQDIFFTLVYYSIPSDQSAIKKLLNLGIDPHRDGKRTSQNALTLAYKKNRKGWVDLFLTHGLNEIKFPSRPTNPQYDIVKDTVSAHALQIKKKLSEMIKQESTLYYRMLHTVSDKNKMLDTYRDEIRKKLYDQIPDDGSTLEQLAFVLGKAVLANKRATEIYGTEMDKDILGKILRDSVNNLQDLVNVVEKRKTP